MFAFVAALLLAANPAPDSRTVLLDAMKKAIEAESGNRMETVAMPMKAGQVGFHHCLTIHGSGPNRSAAPRRTIAAPSLSRRATASCISASLWR